ncbi:DNA repair protein RecN [Thermodesulfovibrio sp.]|uniref:DNA repair protein RecN n=1 Tax=Thermodesulfovibrio sp. TaxID=2067987 RepID=UPI0030B3F643
MIEEIRIRDFAIIESLNLSLSEGFNVLTGETGAGKSIIIDALGVLLKEKVLPADFVMHGKKESFVEVLISGFSPEDLGIDEEILIFRKILNLQGKTRAYINESAYTLQGFSNMAMRFINIHGQHEHTYLLKKENHIRFFDIIAGLQEETEKLSLLYNEVQELNRQVEELREKIKEKKQKLDLLNFQIDEIKKANLKEGEEEELSEKRQILRNIMKIKEIAESSFALLKEDKNSVYTGMSVLLNQIKELSQFDSKAEELRGLIESSFVQIEEAVHILRKLKESYEPDPLTLESIEERLSLISKLKSKYGGSIKEIIEYAEKAEEEIKFFSLSEDELNEKEEKLKELSQLLEDNAKILSDKRKEKVDTIEKNIIEELKFLGFSKPDFKINIDKKPISPQGIDDIEFFFTANPGQPPKPLSKVASGGELSRLMLALKCVELKMAETSVKAITLVFDEIDAGIGGIVAENVGRRMKELARHHQVLCVTHLPQIAAMADSHIKVEKFIADDKTVVKVKVLNDNERKEEIARMLSGRITESSLFHAEELLDNR